MGFPIFQVDAFTGEPFKGNPAAVCLLPEPGQPEWMQNVAREMNLSETAFIVPGAREFAIRWFTPAAEVALCGHATLASAHVLWETGIADANAEVCFSSMSGRLGARREGDLIILDFPARVEKQVEPPSALLDALGVKASYVGRNQDDYLVLVDSEEAVRKLIPSHEKLRQLPVRGVIVTARGESEGLDFVSRFFAPGVGVDEDPVTGSAHCCLGPFWQKRLGKDEFTAYQASARGGIVYVKVEGNRVHFGGQAITVLRGELAA